jgi:hypothetical protein
MLFISYAREDRLAAATLRNELAADGFYCIIDPDLTEGNPFWREVIAQQFPDCELMVCLTSASARRSPWIEQEQRAFLGPKLWIVLGAGADVPKPSLGAPPKVVRADRALEAIRAAVSAGIRQRFHRCEHPQRPVQHAERLRHTQEQQRRLNNFLRSCKSRVRPIFEVAGNTAYRKLGSFDLQFRAIQSGKYGQSIFLGTKPVTNAQYRDFIHASGYEEPPTWRRAAYAADDAPVTGVNWFEACAFSAWVGGSLPTEHDWMRAAIGSDETRHYATTNGDIDPAVAYYAQPFGRSAPVAPATYRPNPEGFYGLCGNTWDWCSSVWGPYRVIRGGGYMDSASFCTIESRYRHAPIDRDCCVGFRVKVKPHRRT